jgi:hypothetical protein
LEDALRAAADRELEELRVTERLDIAELEEKRFSRSA